MIYRHILGSDTKEDQLVYEEKDSSFNSFVYRSKSSRYIMIGSASTLSTEFRYLDADDPMGTFKIVLPREKNHEYMPMHMGDSFYIKTNWKAPNFRILSARVGETDKNKWTEIIPHKADVLIEEFDLFNNFLVVNERIKGLSNLKVIHWKDHAMHYIHFDEETYLVNIAENHEFKTEMLRFSYSSLSTPASVYDYNMKTRERLLLKQQEVLGDFKAENYQAERIYAKTKDGIEIPVSLVYRKGLQKNGRNPLLLYGYGSYGNSQDPYFSSVRLSLLDRGFIFAIAHVRGGEEMGRKWYEDGKLLKKKNTFEDFIACAEKLIGEKYTNADKLFAYGGSAGGLLIGAVINMRPDLFKAVVASVPFVDVVTTMLDESIPLTTGEFDEWGDPKVKEYYDYMLSYAPYDNVERKEYPAMLVITGLHDSQVQYWEPAKWVAKLRDMKKDEHVLLLNTNMEAGHGGASGRFKQHRESALIYAFLLDQAALKK
jgi:oligopeptidase B